MPTIFERDWNGDRSRVLDQPHRDCEWVFAGEGVATRKLDGTCCMIRDGKLYKRQEFKPGATLPDDFEMADHDEETGKSVGWRPVGDGPEDKWHREAEDNTSTFGDGTYELVGPKVQGNPEGYEVHVLLPHAVGLSLPAGIPRTFDGLRDWFVDQNMEGIVFHHPDGRMAKIKKRDFGMKRTD